jgi:hypothetical protein
MSTHNDIQQKETQQNDIHQKDTWPNDIKQKVFILYVLFCQMFQL